jgi:elongator complex protein 5
MSRLISTVISGLSRPHFPFVVLESSLVQSSLPVLRAFISSEDAATHVLLFSLLYPPSTLAGVLRREGLSVVDRTADVPGYAETSDDLSEFILNRVKQGISTVHTL